MASGPKHLRICLQHAGRSSTSVSTLNVGSEEITLSRSYFSRRSGYQTCFLSGYGFQKLSHYSYSSILCEHIRIGTLHILAYKADPKEYDSGHIAPSQKLPERRARLPSAPQYTKDMVCLEYMIPTSLFRDNRSVPLHRDFRVDLGNFTDILISTYRNTRDGSLDREK
jgi:hypothetical protein